MKKSHFTTTIILIVTGVFLTGSLSLAQDVKTRMLERKPVIDSLKATEIVGENNNGFLEFIGNKKEKEDVVQAENADRQTVYKDIANQEGSTAEWVGKRRAMQLEEKTESGQWVQNQEGKWYKK